MIGTERERLHTGNIKMDTAALSKLLESDIARMQTELNYRLLMTVSLAGTVLWVEEVTLEGVTTEETPVEGVTTEQTPVESVTTEQTPVESATTEQTPVEETAPSLGVTPLCIEETIQKLPRPWHAILQWLRAHFHK